MGEDWIFTGYILFWLAVLGAVMGSFLDCAAWRIAHKESLLTGRSHCGSCGHSLSLRDLIPVFSYIFHRGRCRYCGGKIPAECLAAELCGLLMFLGLGWRYGLGPELAMWLVMGCLCLLIALIDWNIGLIPDRLLLLTAANRLIFLFVLNQPFGKTLLSMVIGACSVSVPLLLLVLLADKLLGRETMGGGDIKLIFVLGLYMDWMQMCLVLIAACVLGILTGLLMKTPARHNKEERTLPFGPPLIGAWYLVLLFGEPLIAWYRGILFL